MIQELFIEIMNSFFQNKSPNLPEDVDWRTLFAIAKQQEVLGIVYKTCKEYVPIELRRGYESTFAATIYCYVRRIDMEKQIRVGLRSAGIPFLFLKGTEIAALYSNPELRTMGDTDLLVRPEDKVSAGNVLAGLGFLKTVDTNEWVFLKEKMKVELHHALAYPRDQFSHADTLNNYWEYTWQDDRGDQHLTWEFHLLYLLFHLRRHMLFGGVGFRQFLDIAFVCKNAAVKWTIFKDLADKTGLFDYARTVFAFNERWFDIKNPVGSIPLDESFFASATEKVFRDGVFGQGNDENLLNRIGTISMMEGVSLKKAKEKYLINQMFPPYEQMQNWTEYSYLQGRKYLLPVAWGHRFFLRIVDPKRREGFKERVFVDEAHSQTWVETLKQWGLI